jgi:hypothetical protein
MPVEIRELIIRAVTAAPSQPPEKTPGQDRDLELEREALIQACVKQVLRILKKKEER